MPATSRMVEEHFIFEARKTNVRLFSLYDDFFGVEKNFNEVKNWLF